MLIEISGANVKNHQITRIAHPYEIHHDLRVYIFLGTFVPENRIHKRKCLLKCAETEWVWMSDLRRSQC